MSRRGWSVVGGLAGAVRPALVSGVAGAAGLSLASGSASAHEEYVVDEANEVGRTEFYAEALTDPAVAGPLAVGVLVVLFGVVGYYRWCPLRTDVAAFRLAMGDYERFVPWLLRISFGIPLIGAGFGGYFVSPAVEVELRLFQVALGSLILFGLATRLVALVALAAYFVGVAVDSTLLLQLEFVGGLLAIALVGSGRPSADHVLQRVADAPGTLYGRLDVVSGRANAFQAWIAPAERFLPTVVRVGLGVTFVYLGLTQKLLDPGLALAVIDRYGLTAMTPFEPALWVIGAGLAEVTLGLALLAGVLTRGVAFASLGVFALTMFALPDDPVLAHVGLFGMASVVLILGAGSWSVDARLRTETARPGPTER